ncbi:MAG: hypothetical protein NC250_09750, partial [Alistipes senegalensis]|nr:hypothetical protein [Alistipes senegalensis]
RAPFRLPAPHVRPHSPFGPPQAACSPPTTKRMHRCRIRNRSATFRRTKPPRTINTATRMPRPRTIADLYRERLEQEQPAQPAQPAEPAYPQAQPDDTPRFVRPQTPAGEPETMMPPMPEAEAAESRIYPPRPRTEPTPDPEADERVDAQAKRMKSRISKFFGKINNQWDKGSSADLPDDTEI